MSIWSSLSNALGMVCFLFGVGLWFVVWNAPNFWGWLNRPMHSVQVEANLIYLDKNDIKKTLLPLLKASFFSLDVHVIQETLLENEWLDWVQVKKVWPNKLQIKLLEKKAIARWMDDALISSNGEIFKPKNVSSIRAFSDLPKLFGPEGSEVWVAQQYLMLTKYMRPMNLKISELGQTAIGGWVLKADTVTVFLGRKEIISRVKRLGLLYRRRLIDRWQDIQQVDMRYRDGAALAWKKSDSVR